MSAVWRVSSWTTFLLLCIVFAGSLVSEKLLSQEIWTPAGYHHLAVYAVVYLLWTVALRFFRPPVFIRCTAALAIVYTAAAVGIVPEAAVLLVLFACWVLGRSLLPVENAQDELLSLAAGVALAIFAISLAVFVRVNYAWSYLAALLIVLIACRKTAGAALSRLRSLAGSASDWRGRERLLLELLGFLLFAHLLVVLKPEVSADGLAMHLVIPAQVKNFGLWDFNFHHVVWAVMPMAGDWLFTFAYMLGGEYAARLANYSMLLILAGLLYTSIRSFATPTISMLAVLLFLSSPLVQLVTGSLFVENTWTVLLVGSLIALLRFHRRPHPRWLLASAVLLGCAISAKFGSASFLIPVVLIVAFELRRSGKAMLILPFLATMLVCAAPPYLAAYLKTGNPVFPFLNNIFRSPYFDARMPFYDHRFRGGLHLDTLWQATFRTSQFLESQNGGLGFHYFFLIPLALLAWNRRWAYAAWLSLATSLFAVIALFGSQSNLRYLYPALALFTIASGAAYERFRSSLPSLFHALVVAGIALAGLNFWFLAASGWYHRDFLLNSIGNPSTSERYIKAIAPQRLLIEKLNGIAPQEPVAFLEINGYAGLRATAYTNSWHHIHFLEQLRRQATELDTLRFMSRLGIRWFVAPRPGTVHELPVQWFLDQYTEPIETAGPLALLRLRKKYEGKGGIALAVRESEQLDPAAAGGYDDSSRNVQLRGTWTRDRQFTAARDATLTYSDVPGDSFRFLFHGTAVSYVFTRAANRGIAEISVDGKRRDAIDLYSAEPVWQASRTYDRLRIGTHLLEVKVSGKRNRASAGNFVDVDALVVR